tara:strand:+ start:206 stop:1549 length:1344 start_codon:yes stop_codon:yes gene_type:complete
MKLDLIKTGFTQNGLLNKIPSEILDPLEHAVIDCWKQQKNITEEPTLKSVALDLLSRGKNVEGLRAVIDAINKANVLEKAESEVVLFRLRARAIKKLVATLSEVDDEDEKEYTKTLARIQELGAQKSAQYADPINALNWDKLEHADEDEVELAIDWFTSNGVTIKKKVLYSFIATTNGGKTILKTWFAHHLIKAGQNVLYLAQEEPYSDTIRRIYQTSLGITESQYAKLTANGFKEVGERFAEHSAAHNYGSFYVAEWTGIQVNSIAEWVNNHNRDNENQIDAVIVDYGKLVETSSNKKNAQEWERIGNIFQELKQLAMKSKLIVITSIQLNREASKALSTKDETPDLYDVAGAFEATQHSNYIWSVKLANRLTPDIKFDDPSSILGTYTLTVQKQKYGRLRKGDSRRFHWKTDHQIIEDTSLDYIVDHKFDIVPAIDNNADFAHLS